jgi:ABC-type amino acid transport substrate-binding protein
MHAQWPDYALMKANNLSLVTAASYPELFKMLQAKRFDYFSRGIYQILPEAEAHAAEGLVIEDKLLLHYSNKIYFFVNKSNQQLAARIEYGLLAAQTDGSFLELLNSIPHYRWALEQLEQSPRRVIHLHPVAF